MSRSFSVGWGELVGHKLEGPRLSLPMKKDKKKPVGRKGKKRSATGPTPTNNGSNGSPSTPTPGSSSRKRFLQNSSFGRILILAYFHPKTTNVILSGPYEQ
jgi:hypothetical protein